MARLFGGVNSDRLSLGNPAKLNNLCVSGGKMTIMVAYIRTVDADNLYLASKGTATATSGWSFLLHKPGTVYGVPRFIVGGASFGDADANDADATPLNTPWLSGAGWDGASISLFGGDLTKTLTGVSGYRTRTAPTTPGADNTANLLVGNNSPSPVNAFNGSIARVAIFNDSLLSPDAFVAQQAFLVSMAGNDTRAAAMMATIPSLKCFGVLSYTGTFTDLASTPATGTFTGTTAGTELNQDSAGNSLNLVFTPSSGEFEDDLEYALGAGVGNQAKYPYTSDFARKRYTTTASGFTAWIYGNLDPATYPNQAVLGYDVNGTWTGKLSQTATTSGITSVTVTGLGSSSKTLGFLNGVRSKLALATVPPYQGTFITVIIFTAAATPIAPVARSNAIFGITDSVLFEGFLADSPPRYATLQVARRNLPSWSDGVVQMGAGGQAWYDLCSDSTKRAATVATVAAINPRLLCISLMANDQIRNAWSIATATTPIQTLLTQLLAAFTGKIYLFDTTITGIESATNSFTETIPQWRTFMASLPAAVNPVRIQYNSMIGVLTYPGDISADNVHPTTAAHSGKLDPYMATLLATDPGRFAGATGPHRLSLRLGLGL